MNGLRKYWFPVTVILAAAVQGFASELARGAMPGPRQFPSPAPDTVIYDNSSIYTRFRDSREAEDESLFILGAHIFMMLLRAGSERTAGVSLSKALGREIPSIPMRHGM